MSDTTIRQLTIDTATARLGAALACAPLPEAPEYMRYEQMVYTEFVSTTMSSLSNN